MSVTLLKPALARRGVRYDVRYLTFTFADLEEEAYEFCDELKSSAAVTRQLEATFPCSELTRPQTAAFLDSLVATNRLMVADENCYLSLAIQTPAIRQGLPLQHAVVAG